MSPTPTCQCGDDRRLETFETPAGVTITRCIECGDQALHDTPPAAPDGADPWAAALAKVAATATDDDGGDQDAPVGVWEDMDGLTIPKIMERLEAITDAAERAAMVQAVVAWEAAQDTPRKTVLELDPQTNDPVGAEPTGQED